MTEPEEKTWWLTVLEGIPDVVRKNALIALARGVANIATVALDIPTAHLESFAKRKRATTDGETKIIAATADAAAELCKDDPDLAKRALTYFGGKIVKEQINRESVAREMIEDLSVNPPIIEPTDNVDEDWLSIFWDLAGQKSTREVQVLLGKLLRNEICKPGSVSPHTLHLLSVLTSPLASSFQRLCNISIDDRESAFVVHPNVMTFQQIGPLSDYGIHYNDLFQLDGAGLLRSAETLTLNYAEDPTAKLESVDYAGQPAKLVLAGKQVRLLQFTQAGRELRGLIELHPNSNYTQKLQEKFGADFQYPVI